MTLSGKESYSIFDMVGKEVGQADFVFDEHNKKAEADISKLLPGVYWIKVSVEEIFYFKKFIKQ